jgi:hypothetical protein
MAIKAAAREGDATTLETVERAFETPADKSSDEGAGE